MTDYHIHTALSFDAEPPMKSMAAAAQRAGLTEIGFAEHIDIDFPWSGEESTVVDLHAYRREIEDARRAFPSLRIRKGVEMGLDALYYKTAARMIEGQDLDFVIGSLHLVDRKNPYYPSFWDEYSKHEAFARYAELLAETAQAEEIYDIIGHIGYIGKFYPHQDKVFKYADYPDAIDTALKTFIEKGKGIEVNTSTLKNTASAMPETAIVRRYFELGGEIVTVGSDAHTPEQVGFAVRDTLDLLKSIGFKYTCGFEGRQPIFMPIP